MRRDLRGIWRRPIARYGRITVRRDETGPGEIRQRSASMPGETDLHKRLKKEACRWLLRMGYRCIAAEVRLPPVGIVDAVGTGTFRSYQNYLAIPRELPQVCFIEC